MSLDYFKKYNKKINRYLIEERNFPKLTPYGCQ